MTPRAQASYKMWLDDPQIDAATKAELLALAGNDNEIEDRFYKDLTFGTAGLRGMIGAGTNRMNVYTVGRAAQGLAQFALRQPGPQAVAIAYDSRHMSSEFALESALVLAGNGVTAYLYESLRTTPELSFAVRYLKASAGIVITASHNPPEYNGFKAYGADGGQLVPADAQQVIAEVAKVDTWAKIRKLPREQAEERGLLRWIGAEVDDAYMAAVTACSVRPDTVRKVSGSVRIVYTPLHGTGNVAVRRALDAIGFRNVHVVPEQELPDADFTTVKSPNPEEREAFTLAIGLAEQVGADLIIGTDPDCDRMGAAVKDATGQYNVLTGNQLGALMIHYLLSGLKERDALPADGVIITTIVTSEMGAAIAKHFGVETIKTLTGFKYIGEKMTQFERTGEYSFLFGYEESYGYLTGTYARDKDAVVASMLIAEAAAYCKSRGQTLHDVLQELYRTHGYFMDWLQSRTFKGKDGVERIGRIMSRWRGNPPTEIAGLQVKRVLDYAQGLNGLPKENVLKYELEDESWFGLRPSGTEPKIKVYFAVRGDSAQAAEARIAALTRAVMDGLEG